MPAIVQTREQAVQWLGQRGLRARKHSGWLGEAIFVSKPVRSGPAPTSHEDVLIMYPEGNAWCVARALPGRRGLSQRFGSLSDAVEHVARTLHA